MGKTIETRWGFPIVTAENIYQVLAELGIKPWPRIEPPISLEEYLKRDLTEVQRSELRFAPKAEVVFLQKPNGGSYTGFRSVGKNWSTVFTLLPGNLVPVVGEFKHGAERIVLATPSGVPGKAEAGITDIVEKMKACAKREFQEETGIPLEEIALLCGPDGLPASTRQSTERIYPFLGKVEEGFTLGKSKLDENEFLKLVLVPLEEWMKLIEEGKIELGIISATHLALLELGWLKISIPFDSSKDPSR